MTFKFFKKFNYEMNSEGKNIFRQKRMWLFNIALSIPLEKRKYKEVRK